MQSIIRCSICRRELKNAESRAAGIGPECAGKWATAIDGCGYSVEVVDALRAVQVDVVTTLLFKAGQAVGRGRMGDAKRLIELADDAAKAAAMEACDICDGQGEVPETQYLDGGSFRSMVECECRSLKLAA